MFSSWGKEKEGPPDDKDKMEKEDIYNLTADLAVGKVKKGPFISISDSNKTNRLNGLRKCLPRRKAERGCLK